MQKVPLLGLGFSESDGVKDGGFELVQAARERNIQIIHG